MIRKFYTTLTIALIFLLALPNTVSAKTYLMEAQNAYGTFTYCGLGDRPSYQYTDNIEPYLQGAGFNLYVKWYDWHAWESDLTYSANRVNNATFFIWAGHGLGYNWADGFGTVNPYGEAGIHFFNANSTSNWHSFRNHFDDLSLSRWSEIKWGYGSMKWASAYTCNFLKTGGSSTNLDKILRMFKGLHVTT